MQRQLRLGDILDDYCPRERRVTNHAVVAMIGPDVKQTRCTTCDAEHEYKHAKVPRQRRKAEAPAALYAQALANGPKKVSHDSPESNADEAEASQDAAPIAAAAPRAHDSIDEPGENPSEHAENAESAGDPGDDDEGAGAAPDVEDGPVHRPLIRATLPRPEGQPPPTRPAPEFTIRQPGGRPNRFRHRHGRGGQQFHGNRNGGMPGMSRPGGGRPQQMGRRHGSGSGPGQGRKRQK